MAVCKITTSARNAAADAIVDLLDAGAGAATVKFYTGTQPASAGGALSGNTLLGTLTCSDPAFGAAASGTATASSITSDTTADNSGTATWARIADSDGNVIMDVDVTATGGGGSITLDNTSVTAGGTIAMTSFTVTMPTS